MGPQRHTFAYLTQAGWQRLFDARQDLAQHPIMLEWAAHNRPLIVRTAGAHERDRALLPVGIPLPPAHGKARVALLVERNDVVHYALPPLLGDTLHVAPIAWQDTLRALQQAAISHELELRVFGSLAWQALTGLSYLSATSDVDLLWSPSAARLDKLLSVLATIDAAAPMALDGEVVWPDGRAVNWRELRSGAEEVIVKGLHGLTMANRLALQRELA